MLKRFFCCIKKKISPEEIENIKKERMKILPNYRPIIVENKNY